MNAKFYLLLTWIGIIGGVAGYAWAQRAPNALVGCIYTASLPTLSNNQVSTLRCNSTGQLLTSP